MRSFVRGAFLSLLVTLAVSAPGRAQDHLAGPPGPPPLPPPLSEVLRGPLGLSDEQVEKIRGFEAELRGELDKAHADAEEQGVPPDPEKMHELLEKVRTTIETKVRTVLTAEQAAKLDGLEKEREERGKSGEGERGPPREPDLVARAEKALSATGDEKGALLVLVKKLGEARRTVREADRERRNDLAKFLKEVPGTTDAQRSELAARIKDLRAAAESDAARVQAADASLRHAVDARTEARLIAAGVLD